MAIESMTGFARAAGTAGVHGWAWEIRSVNGRGLDLRVRVPPGFEVLADTQGKEFVRAFYRAQSMDQVRNLQPLDAANKPAYVYLDIPGCAAPCTLTDFTAMVDKKLVASLPRAELAAPHLADLLALDDTGFRAIFAGSPIKRIGRNRFVRNCLYAAGNSGLAGLLPAVRALRGDEDEIVAEAARWAEARLSGEV